MQPTVSELRAASDEAVAAAQAGLGPLFASHLQTQLLERPQDFVNDQVPLVSAAGRARLALLDAEAAETDAATTPAALKRLLDREVSKVLGAQEQFEARVDEKLGELRTRFEKGEEAVQKLVAAESEKQREVLKQDLLALDQRLSEQQSNHEVKLSAVVTQAEKLLRSQAETDALRLQGELLRQKQQILQLQEKLEPALQQVGDIVRGNIEAGDVTGNVQRLQNQVDLMKRQMERDEAAKAAATYTSFTSSLQSLSEAQGNVSGQLTAQAKTHHMEIISYTVSNGKSETAPNHVYRGQRQISAKDTVYQEFIVSAVVRIWPRAQVAAVAFTFNS